MPSFLQSMRQPRFPLNPQLHKI
jgi:hypothetical protein